MRYESYVDYKDIKEQKCMVYGEKILHDFLRALLDSVTLISEIKGLFSSFIM